ncbi:MAG: hypothetical protein EZS28_021331 [Streblomastix strix]|uniref:Uncharacterized protein n=1 Tax=Streblomastix strix TaxID=222440 RepID=A0A5J4VKN7_9EUKA|nr:MAG: hypothetical protein EZS28_021331 [Streblomastix strix]
MTGSCAHFFDVTFKTKSEVEINATVPDLTYGVCTAGSRNHSHWKEQPIKPPSDPEVNSSMFYNNELETHICYYNPQDAKEVVFQLPPSLLLSDILIIGLVLLIPVTLSFATLVWLMYNIYKCTCGRGAEVQNDGEIQFLLAGFGANPNNERAAGDADQQGEQQNNDQAQPNAAQPNLTPAQQQMQAQGWLHPQQSSNQ